MDEFFQAQIQNIINEIENQLNKDHIDEMVSRTLLQVSIIRIQKLMTHIGYLEHKLSSTIDLNKTMLIQAENLTAENQRLTQIARY